ncbi:Eco29kI family restriction endonuclease [Kribbella sp. NPDC051137]|uniref:Eco29kI family restriction endonuclease n=1 Tax=Kribbella sp. NPDC051137 TaxID=3155045 RepID=UPI003414D3F6
MPDEHDYRPEFFDPLSTEALTRIICREFEEQEPIGLTYEVPLFEGSGLYAIYYHGDSEELYKPLADLAIPVYVGQARSHNSATGRTARSLRPLHSRIKQHRVSIDGGGLYLDEFSVRLLCMPDVHIDMGENGLRVGYQPVWNSILTGFGSHEQGSATRSSARTKWDTVHPGRSRTYGDEKHDLAALVTEAQYAIQRQVAEYDYLPWHRATLG